MPFKSLAQEHFLFAKHPEIAKKFAADGGVPQNLPQHVAGGKPPAPHARGGSPWMHMQSAEPKYGVVSSEEYMDKKKNKGAY